jgi:hypothetical protein
MDKEIEKKTKQLEDFFEKIRLKAKELDEFTQVMSDKLHEIFEGVEFVNRQYPRELKFLMENHVKELGLLSAFAYLNEYEKISIRESRGITAYYLPDKKNPVYLWPNGKGSAQILLFSKTENYVDHFATERVTVSYEELLKRFPQIEKDLKKD